MRENKQRESNVSLHLEIINYLKEKGKYPPRSIRQADLIQYGLVTLKDQAAFCETLVGREDNEYGRVLIITRYPDEISSPVRWFARGRESKLGETFVVPHIEPADSGIEVFELVKGEAFLVKYHEDNVNSKKEIIKLEPKKPQIIKPGEIHTILCMSETVEAVEFKLVSSAKIFPNFVKEMGLVDEQGREQSGLTVNEYLNNLHNEVSNFSNSSL